MVPESEKEDRACMPFLPKCKEGESEHEGAKSQVDPMVSGRSVRSSPVSLLDDIILYRVQEEQGVNVGEAREIDESEQNSLSSEC